MRRVVLAVIWMLPLLSVPACAAPQEEAGKEETVLAPCDAAAIAAALARQTPDGLVNGPDWVAHRAGAIVLWTREGRAALLSEPTRSAPLSVGCDGRAECEGDGIASDTARAIRAYAQTRTLALRNRRPPPAFPEAVTEHPPEAARAWAEGILGCAAGPQGIIAPVEAPAVPTGPAVTYKPRGE